jgi:hypothetical protein
VRLPGLWFVGLCDDGGLDAMSVYLESELIYWLDANKEKPDADMTVLVQSSDSSDPVWMGFWDDDDGEWKDINNVRLEGVTRWAELPRGPEE